MLFPFEKETRYETRNVAPRDRTDADCELSTCFGANSSARTRIHTNAFGPDGKGNLVTSGGKAFAIASDAIADRIDPNTVADLTTYHKRRLGRHGGLGQGGPND